MTELITGKALVIGASGFLGSHLTKQLVKAGRDVRILTRHNSNTQATDSLDIERYVGDVTHIASLQQAMQGCTSVFYCVADARTNLRDPAPLYSVHVDGLYNAMDAALEAGIKRFIFTSSFITIGRTANGIPNESTPFNWWNEAPEYIRSLVTAEKRFLEYCSDHKLPGIVCCVGNAYGPEDYAPTLQGQLVFNAANGQQPYYWGGGCPTVGISDAAKALILAEQYGKPGERYAIAERWVSYKELFSVAATAAKTKPPWLRLPLWALYTIAAINSSYAHFRGKKNLLNIAFFQSASKACDIDTSKTKKLLHWQPEPVEQSIIQAVDFYRQHKQK